MAKTIRTYDLGNINPGTMASRGLMISRFAPYLKSHEKLHLPHKHKFYHLIYFTKGSGNHTIDFVNFPVKQGEIYFMSPGQVHKWDFKDQPDGYVINFEEDLFRSFLHDSRYLEQFSFFSGDAKDGVVFLPASLQKEVTDLFESILREHGNNKVFTAEMTKLLLLQIFVITERYTDTQKPGRLNTRQYSLTGNFKKLVDEKFLQIRLPKDYAALLFVTPNHLNQVCKQLLNKSAGEVIRDRILLEAKRLLVNADLNISEIALRLNFTDHSHFSKFFKKETGETPEEFRKNILRTDK